MFRAQFMNARFRRPRNAHGEPSKFKGNSRPKQAFAKDGGTFANAVFGTLP